MKYELFQLANTLYLIKLKMGNANLTKSCIKPNTLAVDCKLPVDNKETKNLDITFNKTDELPAGGFSFHYFDEKLNNPELVCPICTTILRDPVGTNCKLGIHVFCKSCLGQWLSSNNTCPTCRCEIQRNIDEYKTIYVVKNILGGFKCKCKCSWSGTYDQLTKHLTNECKLSELMCQNTKFGCHEKYSGFNKSKHLDICQYHQVPCLDCKTLILRKNQKDHSENQCPETNAECKLCKQKIIRKLMDQHVYQECPELDVPCEYKNYGCTAPLKLKNILSHLKNECKYHTSLIEQKIKDESIIMAVKLRNNDPLYFTFDLTQMEGTSMSMPIVIKEKNYKLSLFPSEYKTSSNCSKLMVCLYNSNDNDILVKFVLKILTKTSGVHKCVTVKNLLPKNNSLGHGVILDESFLNTSLPYVTFDNKIKVEISEFDFIP